MSKVFKKVKKEKTKKAVFKPNYSIILKYSCLSIALLAIVVVITFLAIRDTKIPRKEVAIKIEIANKVNICLPENEEMFEEKSFFDF